MKITIIADNLTPNLTAVKEHLSNNKHLVTICCPDVQTEKGFYHLEPTHALFNSKKTYAKADRDIIYSALQGTDILLITSTNPAEKMAKKFADRLDITTVVVRNAEVSKPHKLYTTCTTLDNLDNVKLVEKTLREAFAKNKELKANKSSQIRNKNLQKMLKDKRKQKRRRRKK